MGHVTPAPTALHRSSSGPLNRQRRVGALI
jgi:hypothetical protein